MAIPVFGKGPDMLLWAGDAFEIKATRAMGGFGFSICSEGR